MTSVQQLPYFQCPTERIEISEWLLRKADLLVVLADRLPGWDPAVSLSIETHCKFDLAEIREDCDLDKTAVLGAVVRWSSPGTGLRGIGGVINLTETAASEPVRLGVALEGKQLAERLHLSVSIILLEPGRHQGAFTPKTPGTILFEQKPPKVVILEGDGSRFPMEIIDFDSTNYPEHAGWVLHWDPDDLDQSVLGDIRLYINSKHEQIKQAVTSESVEGYGMREAIRWDLARTLIYGALQNSEFNAEPSRYEKGTVGAALNVLLNTYFPDRSLKELRHRSQQSQAFEPELQNALRAFWGDGQ